MNLQTLKVSIVGASLVTLSQSASDLLISENSEGCGLSSRPLLLSAGELGDVDGFFPSFV